MYVLKRTAAASAAGAVACAILFAAATPAQATPGGAGWQTLATVSVGTGTADSFQHYPCPAGFIATSGGYFANAAALANGFNVTGTGPRLDETPPAYNEWAWNFVWPNGGAPSGSQVLLNVECRKGKA